MSIGVRGRSGTFVRCNSRSWAHLRWRRVGYSSGRFRRGPCSSRQESPRSVRRIVRGGRPRFVGSTRPLFRHGANVWVAPWRKADGRLAADRPNVGRCRGIRNSQSPRGGGRQARAAGRRVPRRHHAGRTRQVVVGSRCRASGSGDDLVDVRQAVAAGRCPVGQCARSEAAGRPGRHEGVRAGEVRFGVVCTNVRGLLAEVLDEAMNLGLADDHVATKVRSPRVPKVQRRTLSPARCRSFSLCATSDTQRLLRCVSCRDGGSARRSGSCGRTSISMPAPSAFVAGRRMPTASGWCSGRRRRTVRRDGSCWRPRHLRC